MMRQTTKLFVLCTIIGAASAEAQSLPIDTLQALNRVATALRDSGARWGARIWPGYRPDTIPLLYVLRGRGTVLLNWHGNMPDGFTSLPGVVSAGFRPEADRGAASTSIELGGRPTMQMVPATLSFSSLLGLTLHEGFHVFERSVARDDRLFGRGEASWLVSQYPAFDVANEAGVDLEGRLLRAALRAGSTSRSRELARQFSAARERRHRRLEPRFVEFETLGELNEGLAEYALVLGSGWGGERILDHATLRTLDSLTSSPNLSIRLRFYSTGSAMALLLDRLGGPGWQQRLMDEDVSLAELLAIVSGYRDAEREALRRAEAGFDFAGIRRRNAVAVTALRASRRRQADSLVGRSGVLIELDGSGLPGRFIGQCGFDPQNMLQVGDGSILHTRWLRVCSGEAYNGEFNTPVVQGVGNTMLRAVIGPVDSVRLTVAGAPVALATLTTMAAAETVRIESPGLTMTFRRADLVRTERGLAVRLYR